MTEKYSNQAFEIGKLLGALCVIVAFFGGCWFFAYHAYVTAPTTEAIMITLPTQAANKAALELPETIEIEREKPERKWFSALLHPFGFMILLLAIVGAGAGLILLVIYLDRGRDG